MFKTPLGYVQQSPWLGIANKQLELMGRYMTELGMTPASRSRVSANTEPVEPQFPTIIRLIVDPEHVKARRKADEAPEEGRLVVRRPGFGAET